MPPLRTNESAIYAGYAKLERSLAALAVLRASIKGPLPIQAAELEMDDIDDFLETISTKLTVAKRVHEDAILSASQDAGDAYLDWRREQG